jgi:hypothetical protein
VVVGALFRIEERADSAGGSARVGGARTRGIADATAALPPPSLAYTIVPSALPTFPSDANVGLFPG